MKLSILGGFALAAFTLVLSACGSTNVVDKHYNAGVDFQEQGRLVEAIAEYDETIHLNPQDTNAYVNRGAAYDDLGQFQRAIQDYDEAIRLNPQIVGAYNNRGVAYRNLGQFQRAIEDHDEAIRLDPQYARAYAARAVTYTFLGQDAEAQQDFDRAEALGFDPVLLKRDIADLKKQVLEEQPPAAVRRVAAVVPITHGDQIAGSYRAEGTNPPDNQTSYSGEVVVSSQDDGTVKVSWAIETDRWTGIGTITEEGELFVTYTGAFAGTGTWVLRSDGNLYGIWQLAGDSDTGNEVWLTITTSSVGGEASEHFREGYELAEQGRYEEAIAEYDEAIRLDPTYASAYNVRGLAYNKLGQYELGIQNLDEAIRLDPRMAVAYYNRGGTYRRLDQYQRGIEDLDEAIRLGLPGLPLAFVYNDRGSAYDSLEIWPETPILPKPSFL